MINYYLLTKPGILFGNLVTFVGSFLLASKAGLDGFLFIATLVGLAAVMASGCVFNNYIDVSIDRKMSRTQKRPLVTGIISIRSALVFGTGLGLLGIGTLLYFTPLITALSAALGFIVYVLLYSLWKQHTVYGTAMGSIAGATPPLVGYTAASGQLDLGAVLLFTLMIVWQMPHFFSIALYRLEDYAKAHVPVLPLEKGVRRTKLHMTLYIVVFLFTAFLLSLFHVTGPLFFAVACISGIGWLLLSLKGFKATNHQLWGWQMFVVSLLVILSLNLIIAIEIFILNA